MRWLVLGMIAFASLASAGCPQGKIDAIDARISELQDMKRGFEGRALRAEDQANRLQFRSQYYLEARRYFQLADLNREKADAVQVEIDRLQSEKAALQKKHK